MDNLLIKDVNSFTPDSFLQEFHQNGCYNFYDWFCRESSLPNKAKSLFSKVKSLVKANKKFDFSGEGMYVFFKNNCSCYGDGRLYDSFSVCNSKGDVIAWVAPRNPYGKVELSCEGHGFDDNTESYSFDSWRELLNFLKAA